MKFLIRTILILTVLYLLAPIVFAVTPEQRDKLFTETRLLCGVYSKICNPIEVKDDVYLWGQTDQTNTIRLSSALIKTMNEPQVRGVLFHEVGHIVLQHPNRTLEYIQTCIPNCNPNIISKMRRKYEYQADRFATYVGIYTYKEVDLIGALTILTEPEDMNTTHPTHPSTADRIKEIEKILGR